MSLGDLVGGTWLAWLGGVATLLGIVLLLVLAISHGWIGQEARVVLAAAASGALLAAGIWLHNHRGRTEAAVAMVGAGTAGLFAALVVAGEVYKLIPPLLGVAGSMLTGAVASALAIRWAGRAIGALGLVGALLSPLLVGAPNTGTAIALLAVASASAMWVVAWQRWGWLAIAAPLVAAPQWANWMLGGHSSWADVFVLAGFAALGLAGAIATQARSAGKRLEPAAAALLVLNACIAAVIGYVALHDGAGATAAELWLLALAGAHIVPGLFGSGRLVIARPARQLLIVVGVVLADVALALNTDGFVLAIGWGSTAIAFAWLARRVARDSADETLLGLGVGAHIALVLLRALLAAPPTELGTGTPRVVPLLTVATLAASCLASSRLTGPARRRWKMALSSLALAAIAYLTATALSGPSLVAAWAMEGVALAQLHRRSHDHMAGLGAASFVAGAILHTITVEATPVALVTGVAHLPAAGIALGVIAAALLRTGYTCPGGSVQRRWLLAGSAATVLYLASVAIVTAFQPTDASTLDTVLDLSVRQQGQVILSALWSVVGVAGLIVGLRRDWSAVRIGGLALLLLSVVKVFLYDLSTLTSIYRVASFIVLGLLLLAGAFAYQRLRPPPPPDMRRLHPSQR
jgi:uncharacterized membrane protein